MKKTAILLLAAGSSSRLGQPKQLLIFEGKTLLRRLAENALLVSENVLVVLGANEKLISPTLENLPIEILKNEKWQAGMGGSVQVGLAAALRKTVDLEAVILSVCDQPMLSADVFFQIISEKNASKKGIVASQYAETLGVPVLFSKKYFPQLLKLEGERGAKKLIFENENDCAAVDFPGGEWDVDEVQDWEVGIYSDHFSTGSE